MGIADFLLAAATISLKLSRNMGHSKGVGRDSGGFVAAIRFTPVDMIPPELSLIEPVKLAQSLLDSASDRLLLNLPEFCFPRTRGMPKLSKRRPFSTFRSLKTSVKWTLQTVFPLRVHDRNEKL